MLLAQIYKKKILLNILYPPCEKKYFMKSGMEPILNRTILNPKHFKIINVWEKEVDQHLCIIHDRWGSSVLTGRADVQPVFCTLLAQPSIIHCPTNADFAGSADAVHYCCHVRVGLFLTALILNLLQLRELYGNDKLPWELTKNQTPTLVMFSNTFHHATNSTFKEESFMEYV